MPIPEEALANAKVIVTHEGCPDGVASALILRDVYPEAEVIFVQHGSAKLHTLKPSPGMLWCDFAPTRERAQEFVEAGAIVLDHHRGAKDVVALFGDRGVFADEVAEPGVSGVTLAFREVWLWKWGNSPSAFGDNVSLFAHLTGIRDTWQRHDSRWPAACAQAAALRFWPWVHLCGLALWWGGLGEALAIGPVLLAKSAERDERSIREAYHFTKFGVRVLAFEGTWTSDISERVAEEVDLVLGWHYLVEEGKPKMVVSCRSRGDAISALDFAKAHGGGGHRQAAGFTAPHVSGDPYTFLRTSVTDFLFPM